MKSMVGSNWHSLESVVAGLLGSAKYCHATDTEMTLANSLRHQIPRNCLGNWIHYQWTRPEKDQAYP